MESNKESILLNWKTIKQYIEPGEFVRELESCNFLPQSSFENLGSISRLHQATLVLIKVYRKVQLSEKEYKKFVEILQRNETSRIAADVLTKSVGGPIYNTGTVDKHIGEQQMDHLKVFEKKIKDKLKRNLQVVLEIIDNFIECGLLDIDTVEKIIHSPTEASELLVEFVIANIHLGAYNRLLETLKSVKKLSGLVSDLTIAGVGEDVKTAKHILREERKNCSDVIREIPGEISLSIKAKPENPEIYRALQAPHSSVDLAAFNHLDSTIEKKEEGSAIFRFAHKGSKHVSAVKDKIQQGAMPRVMEDIIKHMDGSALKGVSYLEVMLRCSNDNKSNMSTAILPSATLPSRISASLNKPRTQFEQLTTESVQHTMNVAIIAANRSFLIEEINTMALVRAFQDKGITFYDGLDGILERQQRAEHLLTILEKNNLPVLEELLVILREQDMTYVLDRLNNCRNAYSADPQILERNISNSRINILDNLDIDDVREIFIEREVFSSSMFDDIEEKYSGSEDQMSVVLIEIIKSGLRAMIILVDALYINQVDSLAVSLLTGTSKEFQEMQDNTETDESSSDGELLYEATFVVSNAVEKPPDV